MITVGTRVRPWFATDIWGTVKEINEVRIDGRVERRQFKLKYDSRFQGPDIWFDEKDLVELANSKLSARTSKA